MRFSASASSSFYSKMKYYKTSGDYRRLCICAHEQVHFIYTFRTAHVLSALDFFIRPLDVFFSSSSPCRFDARCALCLHIPIEKTKREKKTYRLNCKRDKSHSRHGRNSKSKILFALLVARPDDGAARRTLAHSVSFSLSFV